MKLVFMDNVPKGLVAGKDYVSVVSADNYGNGVAAGLLMAKFLKGKGTVGAVFHAADFFVTKQRYQGFQKAISEFPDIKIIESQGIGGPDFSGDAEKVASAMITAHPEHRWNLGRVGRSRRRRDLGRAHRQQERPRHHHRGLGRERRYQYGEGRVRQRPGAHDHTTKG